MNNILYIKSSITGANSQSNVLVDTLQKHWEQKYAQARHVVKDLAQEPLPHLRTEHLTYPDPAGLQALQELKEADMVVLAAPMYNFSIPSTLKAWFDHVLKSGETFEYTQSGPRGLLEGKSAVILLTTGGVYSAGDAAAFDFASSYVKTLLGFIGIVDVRLVRAEGLAFGEIGEQSMTSALAEITKL